MRFFDIPERNDTLCPAVTLVTEFLFIGDKQLNGQRGIQT